MALLSDAGARAVAGVCGFTAVIISIAQVSKGLWTCWQHFPCQLVDSLLAASHTSVQSARAAAFCAILWCTSKHCAVSKSARA